jgi:MFS family permease
VGGVVFLLCAQDAVHLRRREAPARGRGPRWRGGRYLRTLLPLYASFAFFFAGTFLFGPNLSIYLTSELGLSKSVYGSVVFIGTGVATLLQPLTGMLSDKYGRKPVMVIGAISVAVGNLLLLAAQDLVLVTVSQIFTGYWSAYRLAGNAYIVDVVSPDERSSVIGVYSAIGAMSAGIASVVGGLILALSGIPAVILAAALLSGVAILTLLPLRERRVAG